jgi:hypothetical protein
MSSMAALVFLAVASASPTLPDADISAEQAMANYRAMTGNAVAATPGAARACLPDNSNDIVVCAQHPNDTQRLPLRDERAEPGEVVRHPSEPPPAAGALNDKPQCQYNCGPSPAKENWGRLFKILKGEDPDD